MRSALATFVRETLRAELPTCHANFRGGNADPVSRRQPVQSLKQIPHSAQEFSFTARPARTTAYFANAILSMTVVT